MDKRKIRKIKKRRRKIFINRCIIIFSFLAVVGFVIFGFVKLVGGVFAINDIYVGSNAMYDKEAILEAAGVSKGESLLFLDTSAVESRICKKLPYIQSAKVKKKFPKKLEVETELTEAKFSLFSEDSYFLSSKEHKFLEKKEDLTAEIANIIGVEFSVSEKGEIIYKDSGIKEIIDLLINSLEKNHLANVKQIDLSDKNSIKLNYDGRINIILGSKNDIDYKILTAHELITNKIKPEEKGSLDLSELSRTNRSYFTQE